MISGALAASADPKLEQLRRLTDIGRALTYTTSLEQAARLTVERGASLLDAPAAVLMLSDAGGLLHVRGSHGIPERQLAQFEAPALDEVAERLQGLLGVSDERLIAVPLVVGGTVTGLLAVALAAPATAVDEWLLSAVADQAAVALEGSRLGGEVRLEMEGRLRESEGATSAKDRALSTLAHDIRSPLGAIDGYSSNLEDGLYGPVSDRQREALARIRMSGRHLLSLLDTVMEMARLTAGVVPVLAERVKLSHVAREALDILAPAASAKHQALHVAIDGEVAVSGEAVRIRQVLVNLIGNAVKFTPEGGTISVSVAAREASGRIWGEVRIADTGPGIAEAERLTIFEPYYRSAGTAQIAGFGLGLAISHALVQQMGGTLSVESAEGEGSTFVLRLSALA